MTILSYAQIITHVETDLAEAAVQTLLDATEELIIDDAGDVVAGTEVFNDFDYPWGRDRAIYLSHKASSITTIKERDHVDDVQLTLSADDFRLESGRRLMRLREGTNSRLFWAPSVEVIYVPESDTNIRELVQINLVKMAVVYNGVSREEQGDFEFWHVNYADETRKQLSLLHNSKNRMLIT